MLAHQPPDAAPEREPGNAGARDQPAGHGEPEGLRLVIEVRPGHAGLGDGALRHRVHPHALHGRQVDDHSTVGDGEPGQTVRAAAHRHLQVLAAGELDGRQHVGGARAPDDERRMLVDHPVPDRSGRLVPSVVGGQDHPADALP
jgi:hypothetical protein